MVKCFAEQIAHLNDDDDDNGDDSSGPSAKDSSSCSSMMQKRFLRERKIFLWGSINDMTAKDITEKLL
ncbi:MAG: hypothetical protein LBK24_02785, partial [Puniceicoccales bacterium]|nr:hypothetical protein [Puniceicoccales bacterium]